jgi:pyridoxamine 5'-phosphate oxidase
MDLREMRKEYIKDTLDRKDLAQHPLDQFAIWFEQASQSEEREANGMVLSTVSPQGRPSSRVVLLKEVQDGGFVFYTNYTSRKSQEIHNNAYVSLVFWWSSLERQVRVEGKVEILSEMMSDAYFISRPYESRISALASPQSSVLENRASLEELWKKARQEAEKEGEPKRPDFWGGWRVIPDRIEFWQGRSSRLHDRFVYQRTEDNQWSINRLAP